MRIRTPTRVAVTVLAAISVVLGVTTPGHAVSADAPTGSPDAPTTADASADAAQSDAGPAEAQPEEPAASPATAPSTDPSSTTARERSTAASMPEDVPTPETRRSAAPTARPTIDLALAVAKDGNGPFTTDDQPGGDAGAANGIVRTFDAITYRVTMNSNGGDSENERFTLTAPDGTSWAGVPGRCTGAGSAIRGQDMTCNLGTVAEGQAVAVPAVLNVSGDLRNGDQLAVSATGTADDADNGAVSVTSPTTVVSAAARYNLSKNVLGSKLRTGVVGPDGTTVGIRLVYPIAVDWQPLVAGQGLLGFEKSAGSMTFTDDVSELLGDIPSNAVVWNGGDPACGPNAVGDDWRMGGLPAGKGGGDNAVVDSGTFTCTQDGPGQDIRVTLTGTVTDPTRIPTRNLTNGPITGGEKPYFVSGYISLWMPNPSLGTSVDSVNTYTSLQTTSISGAANFPGGGEPTGDNSAARNIVKYGPGGADKTLYRVLDDGSRVASGSAKHGDPWATAGTVLRSDLLAWNDGLDAYDDAILCDTFDRSTQTLTRVKGRTVAWTSNLRNAKVQYAAYDMSSAAAGQKATCTDDDGPWYDRPEDVPGGISAVGKVRATGDISGGDTATLFSYVTTNAAANGTRAYDFGHVWFGEPSSQWYHGSDSDPDLGAGPLADSVILTENLARIAKKVIDPGHGAADTPDRTSFAVAGDTIDYALYPSLTNGNTTGKRSEVTVQDVLPLHTSYVSGSASKVPVVDTIVDGHGKQHQRLTWEFSVTPNDGIDPLTYTAAVSEHAPDEAITNQATIESPSDWSAKQYRQAERAVQIVGTGGVGVEKRAVAPVVVDDDRLEWKLDYRNIDDSPIERVDLIDVLPFTGDGRNSSFHGTVSLADRVAVDPDAEETVSYTDTDPADVVMDGKDPSNQDGGSTTWCDAADFGTEGCPADLSDVTAFRLQRGAPLAVGDSVTHQIAMVTEGAHDDDTYTNQFGLSASNLDLGVESNPATIRVVAGLIGDHVWSDTNGNGIQDAGEPGIEGVPVRLTGTDDRGTAVDRATTTGQDGNYAFDGLRPGAYVVAFTAPDGRQFTREDAGDDRAKDSDADSAGSTAVTTIAERTTPEGALDGVDRIDTVDAGILPAQDADESDQPDDAGSAVTPNQPREPASPGSPSLGNTTRTAPTGKLAFTGAEHLPLVIVCSFVLLGLGTALAVFGTRRNRARKR